MINPRAKVQWLLHVLLTLLGSCHPNIPSQSETCIEVSIYERCDALRPQQGEWRNNVFSDTNKRSYVVVIPDSRVFRIDSDDTTIGAIGGKIWFVQCVQVTQQRSLADTLKYIKSKMAEFGLQPEGSVKSLIVEMNKAIPQQGKHGEYEVTGENFVPEQNALRSYWGDGKGVMKLSANANLEVAVRQVGFQSDSYIVGFTIEAPGEWVLGQK